MNFIMDRSFQIFGIVVTIAFWLFATGCNQSTAVDALNLERHAKAASSNTPVPLRLIKENKGVQRCEDGKNFDMPEPHEDTDDYQRCKNLQKKLNQAAWDGDIDGIRKSIEDGANVRAGYYEQGTPLGLAITKGRYEAVRLLIENGADVNVKYKWDETPLIRAAYYNFHEIAEILLENGAELCSTAIDDSSLQRLTALDIAEKEGHQEMIRLLKAVGAGDCQ